jgi:hypothetical protein
VVCTERSHESVASSNSVYGENRAIADRSSVNLKEEIPGKGVKTQRDFYFSLRLCAFARVNFCAFTIRRYKLTVKSRVRANVMGLTTPNNLENQIRLYSLIKEAIRRRFPVYPRPA